MKKLSICIPTYNRITYLKKNLDIIIKQIIENKKHEIEICISDNASIDNTEFIVRELIELNPDIKIKYSKNDLNLGADKNYLKAMSMADGDYSILWGDDDFFKDNAISYIFNLIEQKTDVSIFFSNRTDIDGNGNFICEQIFLRDDIESLVVDFSRNDSARLYFYLSRDIACLFSYISSVIYKTSIIKERVFDNDFIGTQYSFLYFWWNHLLEGNKLLYSKYSYVYCTTRVAQSFGSGIDRAFIDYYGYNIIADKLLYNNPLITDFREVVNKSHKYHELSDFYISDKKKFEQKLQPLLIIFGYSRNEIAEIKRNYEFSYLIKLLIKKHFRIFVKLFKIITKYMNLNQQ